MYTSDRYGMKMLILKPKTMDEVFAILDELAETERLEILRYDVFSGSVNQSFDILKTTDGIQLKLRGYVAEYSRDISVEISFVAFESPYDIAIELLNKIEEFLKNHGFETNDVLMPL